MKAASAQHDLKTAWEWRRKAGHFNSTETLRVFYGPGETAHPHLKSIAIDLFGEHAWITQWANVPQSVMDDCISFLKTITLGDKKISSIVLMDRSQVASEKEVQTIWGEPPEERFTVMENSVPYLVQFTNAKHPGLFLDHAPLREWLKKSQSGKRVLNLFSYTGSLSVAAGVGGASHVTTLDLSKSTIEWAEASWKNASFTHLDFTEDTRFIYGDVFEWLPKFIKKNEQYDTILCDPPSFSRSKNGVFSTNKDSGRLHELIIPLLKSGGTLVTSINSENYPEHAFLRDIHYASEKCKARLQVLKRVDLPDTFPTHTSELSDRYLKGFYLLRV